MTTYSKETALYNTGAIGDDIEEAGTKADNYLTDISGGGVMVHPSNDSTSGWKISSALELLKSGASYIWAGLVNSIATVRIGKETGGHSVIDENGMRVYGGSNGGTQLANIGYGEGQSTSGTAFAPYYSLGKRTGAIGNYSVSEGYATIASGFASHAEGTGVGDGIETKASGHTSHAEGNGTIASGFASHAEGGLSGLDDSTTASGYFSHAEGQYTIASGFASHAEGGNYMDLSGTSPFCIPVIASGSYSHAQNLSTTAQRKSQTAIGEFNEADTIGTDGTVRGKYAFIIGNGTSDNARSNALTVDWDGNVDIVVGAKYKINGTALSASDVGAVPTTRTVNSKALSSNITLSASDVGAVPTTRKVNSKALSSDITLSASDVSAVPTTRTVNSKALSSDITLSASDVGAADSTEFNKQANNHLVIGGYHVCWGSLTVSSPTLNAYAEQTVTLPYTYTSTPFCIASCAGRAARHRTAYASQGDQTGNKIRVGYYATASGVIYINYLTIGV